MKVIKKINNNVALCLDGNQRELIAFGKGIGFKPIPYELTDLSVIERTYYGISPEYQGLLKEIPKEIERLTCVRKMSAPTCSKRPARTWEARKCPISCFISNGSAPASRLNLACNKGKRAPFVQIYQTH